MIDNFIKNLKKDNILEDKILIKNLINNLKTKETLYKISSQIFENPNLTYQSRLDYHLELIKISKQKRCDFSIAHNLNLSSRVYSVLDLNNHAIKNDLKALKIWKNLKNEPLAINGEISCYANLGSIYLQLGLFKKALEYFQKGLESLKKCKDDLIPFIRINLGLGNTYAGINQYRRAESYYINAIKQSKKTKNQLIIIPCKVAAANMKFNYKDYDSAINEYKSILKIINEIDDVNYKFSVLNKLGLAYLNLKKYKLAEKYLKMYFKLSKDKDNFNSLSDALFNLGRLYFTQKKNSLSLKYFNQSYNMSLNSNTIKSNYEVLNFLSKIYERKNDLKSSLKYHKKYVNQLNKYILEKDKINKQSQKKIVTSLASELDIIKEEKDRLQRIEDINSSQNNIISNSLIVSENNDFLKSILFQLNNDDYSKEKTIKKINDKINSSQNWKDYLDSFEKINSNFRFNLNKIISKPLTQTEYKICTFIKIGFDNYEISGILSIGLRGVQQHRYRIKKKMNLNKDKLDYIISNI